MKTAWMTKIKDNLLGVAFTAVLSLLTYGSHMMLDHDKKLALIDQKLTILVKKLAPELDVPIAIVPKRPEPTPVYPIIPDIDLPRVTVVKK